METKTTTPVRQMAINAVVTRANGTIEDLGTVDYYHANPLIRTLYRVMRFCGWRGIFWKNG